jgi:4-hydroxybenzoate polyprenyltransferase
MSSSSRSAASDFRQLLAFSRHGEWLLSSVLPLFGTFFVAEAGNPGRLQPTVVLAWCAVFLLGTGCGYMLNNLSDLEVDRRAGKPTPLDHWTYGARLGLALTLEAASLALTLWLSDVWTLAAIAVCHLIAWTYSYPPRFKEHVWLGPIVASAQFWAPSAVVLVAWRVASPAAICWVALLGVYGLRITIVHQAIDWKADIATGVHTTAVSIGQPAARALLRYLFSGEVLLCLLLIGLLVAGPLAMITTPLLVLPVLNMAWRRVRGQQIRLDTYEYVPLSEFYETVMPLALVLTLLIRSGATLLWPLAFLGPLLLVRHRARLRVLAPVL